ncbi:unnamed protein product [Protopolystoma xenopodis]|uniref:Trematode PH-like domain-containing protein n=1 Tax=Protopolystoma xenopodis TaxID=117903 RepID=A0A3S5BCS1_9PLAT|nr:unnamed protein product [Protopolystoma xenopodis]
MSRQQLDSINQEKEVYGVQVKKADTFSDLGCEGPVELRASLQPHLQGNHFLQSSRRQTSSAQPRRSFIAKSLQHFRQLSSQQTRPANISETNPTLAPLTSQRLHEARWRSADKAVSEKGVNGLQPPVYRMESTPLASRDDLPPIGTGRQSRYSQNSRSAGGPPVAVKAAKRSASLVSVTKFTINRESENSADMNRWPRKDRQGRLVYYECRASLISEHSVRPDSRYSQLEEERLLLKYYGKKPLGSCLLRFYDGTIYLKKLWKLSVKTYRNLISYRSILDIYTFTDYNTMLVIKMRRKNEDISYLVLNFRAGEALQRTRDIIISAMSNPESEVDNALYDPGISEGQQSPVSTHSGFDYDDPPLPDESVEPRVKHSITQLDRQERSYRAFYEFGFDPPPGRLASKASWPSMRPAHQPSVAMTSSYPRHGSLQLRPVFLSPHNQQEIPLVPEMMLVPGDRSGLPEERAWYTNDLAYASPSHPGPSFAARPRWYGLNPPVLQNNLMPNQSAHLASTISTGVNSLPDAYWSTNAIYSDLPLPSNGPFFTEPGISDHLRGRPNLQAAPRFPSRTASETDKSALMSSRRLPLQATNGARRNSLRRLGRSISVGSQAGEAHGLGNTSAQLSGGNFKSANEKTVILPVYVYTNDPAKLGNSLI